MDTNLLYSKIEEENINYINKKYKIQYFLIKNVHLFLMCNYTKISKNRPFTINFKPFLFLINIVLYLIFRGFGRFLKFFLFF
jgi:hypothetical protein